MSDIASAISRIHDPTLQFIIYVSGQIAGSAQSKIAYQACYLFGAWNRVALEANVAVVWLHHFTKGPGIGVDKASGAHAIAARSRSVVPLSTPCPRNRLRNTALPTELGGMEGHIKGR